MVGGDRQDRCDAVGTAGGGGELTDTGNAGRANCSASQVRMPGSSALSGTLAKPTGSSG